MLKKTLLLAGISSVLLYTRYTALAIGIMSASPLFINYAQLYSEIKNYTTTYVIQRVFHVRDEDNDASEEEYDYHDSDYCSSTDSCSSSSSSESSSAEDDVNVNDGDDLDLSEYEDYPRECDHDQLLYYLSKKLPNTDYAHAVRVLSKVDSRVHLVESTDCVRTDTPDKIVIPVNTNANLIASINDVAHFYCL